MATEAEIIASNVLASAIEYKRLYDTTKNNEYKVKEQRLRRIAENIKLIVGSNSSSAVSSFNGRTGAVILQGSDVTGALGYTPLSAEVDTLDSVTTRGNTTTNAITVGGLNLGTNVGVTSSNAFGLNYIEFNALTATQGISALFKPAAGSTGYAYDFEFRKDRTTYAGLLIIGGNASAGAGTANKNIIAVDNSGSRSDWLAFRVAATNSSWGGATDLLSLTHTQNVLIGTTTDAGYKLDVNGTGRVSGNLTVDTNTLFVDATSNRVGIGTTTPAYPLDVVGQIQASSDIFVGLYNKLAWGNNGYNYLKFSGGYLNMGYISDAFKFDMNSSTVKSIEMVADSDFRLVGKLNRHILLTPQGTGNVGIGTTTPTSKLEVKNGTVIISDTNTGSQINLGIGLITVGRPFIGTNTNTNNLEFGTRGNVYISIVTNSTEKIRITNTGNLLIGTTTDAGYKLRVQGTVSALLTNATHADQVYYNSATGELTYGAAAGGSTPTLDQVVTAGNSVSNNGITITRASGATLTLNPGASDNAIVINNSGFIKFTTGADSFIRGNSTTFSVLDASYVSKVAFSWGGSASWINTGGNLLIGTTTDAGYKLDVVGADSRFNGVRVGLGGGSISSNTVVGSSAFNANTTGSRTVAIGESALQLNTTGANQVAIGWRSLYANSTGSGNQAFGYRALENNATGNNNTAVGYQTLQGNISGVGNVGVGNATLYSNTASGNTAVGYEAAYSNTTGVRLTAIGYTAARSSTGGSVTAVGFEANKNNTTGTGIVAVGSRALLFGYGNANTAIGEESLTNVGGGANNTAVGYHSLRSLSTGSGNVALGYQAGYNETGSDKLYIGNSSTNTLIYGDFSTGNVSIGSTVDAGYKLDVNGSVRAQGGVYVSEGQRIEWAAGREYLIGNGGRATMTLNQGGNALAYSLSIVAGGFNQTSGTGGVLSYAPTINPTSGTAVFNLTNIAPTINQTGGANGITRGLYINPTLTSAADFRAIQTTAGKVIHQGLTNATHPDAVYYNSTTGELTFGPVPAVGGGGTVTSVAMTVPTGLTVSGSPITSAGTLALTFASGYSIPTTASQANWDTAFSWGDHSLAGYLTSYTETDPTVPSYVKAITSTQITNWDAAYGWGNHALAGYLTSFTETDPTVPSHVKAITTTQVSNWDTAFGWGNHASAGYVPYTGATATVNLNTQQLLAGHTTLTTNGSTDTLTINHTSGSGKAINVTKGGNGEGLYINKTSGSGNAATIIGTLQATTIVKTGGTSAQFLKADGSVDSNVYLTSFTETDPIFTASPSFGITSTNISNWNTAYGWGNHATVGYLTSQPWVISGSNIYYTTGNVGIGTTNPSYKLDVAGDIIARDTYPTIYVDHSGTVLGGIRADATTKLEFKTLTTAPLSFQVNNSQKMTIQNTGNVLIGTNTDAGHRVEVAGGVNSNSYYSLSGTLAATTNNYLYRVGTSLYWKRNRVRSYIERAITGVSTDPANYNKYYEIGSFAFVSLEGVFNIDISFNGSGYGQGSRHVVPVTYRMDYISRYTTGLGTVHGAGVWLVVDAISQTPRHLMPSANNWELQMNVIDNSVKFRIVIRGGGGTGVATAFVKISHNNDFDNSTYTELTGVGVDATVYPSLPAIISGINGKTHIQNNLTVIGNVGIGISNPAYKLEVNGSIGGSPVTIARFTAGAAAGGTRGLNMYSDGSQFKLQVSDNAGGIGTWAFLNLNPDGGNVGIGTTSPAYNLDVVGSTNGIIRAYGTNLGRLSLQNSSKHYSTSVQGTNWLFYDESGGAERMRITGNGNVLIGTTTDAGYKLDVNGTAKLRGNVDIVTSGNTNVFLAYSSYVQAWQTFYVSQSGGVHNFAVSNASSGGSAYFNNVNVGIGTTTPSAKLHVVGDIKATLANVTTANVVYYDTTTGLLTYGAAPGGGGGGTVTSVAMSVPTGLVVAGSPITTSGTLAVTFAAGYSIPTTTKQTQWDTAYTNRIATFTTSGSSGAATFTGNTLNIPNYTLAGLGYTVPTLAQVTTAGNTTTNAITVGGLTVDTTTLVVDAVNDRVGVGTASPTYKLHVAGTTRNTQTRIDITPTVSTLALDVRGTGTPNDYFTLSNATGGANDVFLPIFFYKAATYGYNGGTNRYPSGVYGGGFIAAVTDTSYPSAIGAGAAMHFNARTYANNGPLNNRYLFSWGSWLTTHMAMTAGGNLLIGTTTNSGYKLDVNGNARISGTIEDTGGNSSEWNLAYLWGDHSLAGYLTGTTGYTGIFTIPTNPPGQQNLDIQNGLIINVF